MTDPPKPGESFGDYRIEAELARDDLATVLRARELAPDRLVTLTVIGGELASEPGFGERFDAECRLAARVEHPNVARVYTCGVVDGLRYQARQHVPGADLRTEIAARGRLAPARAVAVVEQAAAGLDAIHAAGLVHRRLEPASLWLMRGGEENRVLVVGHGVGHRDPRSDDSGSAIDHAAPEQLADDRADARADVYALGCVLFEALTGRAPYPFDNDQAKAYGHFQGDVPQLDGVLGPASVALDPVIARALAKRPDDRFPSAGDLGRAARAALDGKVPTRPERVVGVGAAAPAVATAIIGEPGDELAEVAGEPATATRPEPGEFVGSTGRELGPHDPRGPSGGNRNAVMVGAVLATLLVAGGIVFAVLALAGGDSSSGTSTEAVASTSTTGAPTSTAEASTAATSAVTPATTTGASTTAQGSGGGGPGEAERAAAVAVVEDAGFEVFDPFAYRPDNTLAALVGTGANGASDAPSQVFFFVEGKLVGTDAPDPSLGARLAYSNDTEAGVTYQLFDPGDEDCCSSGGTTTVRFGWNGSKLKPLDPVPPADPKAAGSRR